ncbi:hypothetical protein ACFL4N_04215 [Thermodesulfobacteriota bacterium]
MGQRLRILAWCLLFTAGLAFQGVAAANDNKAKVSKLLSGLEQRAKQLRALDSKNPGNGIGRIADDLEARVKALRKADYSDGWILFGDAAAYVSVGNSVKLTKNFFSGKYTEEEQQAILLHEAVHLDQNLFEKKIEFWGDRGEIDAYKEEYKWLTVLGVDKGGFERLNVLQALKDDYGAIKSDEKTKDLEKELGLNPDVVAIFREPAIRKPSTSGQGYENGFYSFRVPGDWIVEFDEPGSAKQRYAHLRKEVIKTASATLGVYLVLGEVIGAGRFNPGVPKLRNQEMAKDKKWDFSGGKDKRTFTTMSRRIAGLSAEGYRETTITEEDNDTKTVRIIEKFFFEKDQVYYYTEFRYNKDYEKAVMNGYKIFLATLQIK